MVRHLLGYSMKKKTDTMGHLRMALFLWSFKDEKERSIANFGTENRWLYFM